MKKKSIIIIVLLVALLTLFVSCSMEAEDQYGSLELTVSSSKTVTPSASDLSISEYKVFGTHANGSDSFVHNLSDGRFVHHLLCGAWTVHMEGYNSNGVKVAESSLQMVKINKGSTTSASFQLMYVFSGEGTVILSVSYPNNNYSIAAVNLEMTDIFTNETISKTILKEDSSTNGSNLNYQRTYDVPSSIYDAKIALIDNFGDEIYFVIPESISVMENLSCDLTYVYESDLVPIYRPQASIKSSNYSEGDSISVELNYPLTKAKLYYTLDGSDPTQESEGRIEYSVPIQINDNRTLKIAAEENGVMNYNTSSEQYHFKLRDVSYTLTSVDKHTKLRVTLDNPAPDCTFYHNYYNNSFSSNPNRTYEGDIIVETAGTLTAYATKLGFDNSNSLSISCLKAIAPEASLSSGTYYNNQLVTLTSSTDGSAIYYTIDGSNPTEDCFLCPDGGIIIDRSCTLKAVTVKDCYLISDVFSRSYTMKCSNLTASVPSGTYNNDQIVILSSDTEGCTIYYTLDGNTPTADSSVYPEGGIVIDHLCNLNAVAIKEGYKNSSIITRNYYMNTSIPTASIPSGTYNNNQIVTLSSDTEGCTIYYTLDGSSPTTESFVYPEGGIVIDHSCTLNASAEKEGYNNANCISRTYTMNCSSPVASVPSGTYYNNQIVTLSSDTEGCTIYYTLDGSSPTAESSVYPEGGIIIDCSCILNAVAIKEGYSDSSLLSQTYTITCAAPEASVSGGTYNNSQTVTLTSATEGCAIYYSLDGSNPTENSILYTGGITVDQSCTLKAVAIKGNFVSDVFTCSYTLKCSTPVASVSGATYSSASQTISLTSATEGCSIYYTLDGSNPTENSILYTGGITVNQPCTLKAIAIKGNYTSSEVLSVSPLLYRSISYPSGTSYYSWTTTSSPSSDYYCYCSTNNGKSSSYSVMKIVFNNNLDSFTLYIRSYAESGCDYVVVSNKNASTVPTSSSSSGVLANTSNNQNSGTSISSYTPVTINSIQSGDFIYVVYRKDGSVNSNDDRGYVLLPKLN